jgi:hypothetical protein
VAWAVTAPGEGWSDSANDSKVGPKEMETKKEGQGGH